MPIPALAVSPAPIAEWSGDVLVVGVGVVNGRAALVIGADVRAALGLDDVDLPAIGAGATAGEVWRLPLPGGAARSLALVGLGTDAPDVDGLRAAAGAATRRIRGATSLGFALPVADVAAAEAVLEGAALGAYAYSEYRSTAPAADSRPAAELVLLTGVAVSDAVLDRVAVVVDVVALTKDLVNASPLDLYPETLAAIAAQHAEAAGVAVRVWDEDALRDDGFGGLLGVGSGSSRPPRLVRLDWQPEGATQAVALVGKGITFDSGGLSLKPPVPMVGMKYDMTGAATVLAAVLAAARLLLPVRVTAWLCLAENMPSGTAIRPNDVLRIHGGTTVEVLNTDAEGRLVLADGLVAASAEHPDLIVDVATLTGAAAVALGTRTTAVMGDAHLAARVTDAAQSVGEPAWHMPLPGELRAVLKSDVADIANAKPGNTAGGMLLAGVFLRDFVGRTDAGTAIPWAHLDIAATASNAGTAWGHIGSGPTGVMVRTLVALLRDVATPATADAAR